MQQKHTILLLPALCVIFLLNCATFRSEMSGEFDGETRIDPDKEKVNVLFILRHIKQAKGLDAIPKLQRESRIIRDFDNMFFNAFGELSNVDKYATFTEFPSDVSKPERRAKLTELISKHDYVLRIKIIQEFSFIRQFLGGFFSTVSLTLIPVPYKTSYGIEAEVYNKTGVIVEKYERSTSIKTWVQMFLVFAQPFHNEIIKKEQIYLEFLHDIFKQIESENILSK